MKRFLPLLLTGAMLLAALPGAQAQILHYTFGSGASLDPDPTTEDANASGSTFAVSTSSGLLTYNNTDPFGAGPSGRPAVQANSFATDMSFDADTNDFYSFTLEADAGFQLNLTSLRFYTSHNGGAPSNYTVQYAVGGFPGSGGGTSFGTGTTDPLGSPPNVAWGEHNHALSLTTTSLVAFRIYGWGVDGSGSGNFRLDDVQVFGSVTAVPEPTALALGAGMLGALLVRRRR